MRRGLVLLMMLLPAHAGAETFTCTYRWAGKLENHPILIEVDGATAVTKGGYLNPEFRVIENSPDELIIIETNTKKRSGKDYPIGASLIILDKATKRMVRSNTHTDESFNNHAVGTCSPVLK